MFSIHEQIVSVQDLVEGVEKAILKSQQGPLLITENGRPAAYLVGAELFNAIMSQLAT